MTDNDVHRFLVKNVRLELDALLFYLNNLEKLNYSKNRRKVDKLTLDCLKHAEECTKKLLQLHSKNKGELKPLIQLKAQKEEIGLQEVYKYELNRTKSPSLRKFLKELIKQEESHEKLVMTLK